MKTYLPEKLNLLEHIKIHTPINIPKFSIDKLAYFLHLVTEISVNNDLFQSDGYVPMYSPLLKKVDYHYRRYLDYAVQTGILLEDRKYIIGKKSRGFKFAPQYPSRLKEHINNDSRFAASVARKRKNEIDTPHDIDFLAKFFLDGGLEFDFDRGLELLDRRDEFFKKYPEKIPKKKDGKFKNPITLYNSALMKFQRLQNDEYHISVDPTVGRLHTNITTLPSEWRNLLTYKGEQLVCIDIANCQPYLSTATLQPDFYEHAEELSKKNFSTAPPTYSFDYQNTDRTEKKGKTKQTISNNVFKELNSNYSNYNSLIMLVKSSEPLIRQEIQQYTKMCSKGVIYEYLEKRISDDLGIKYQNRDEVKKAIFQTLFSDNRFIALPAAKPKRLFRNIFPTVYRVFYHLKIPNKTILPRLLMSKESHLILHVISKRIHRENRNVILFTVHDSVVTTEKHAEYVQGIMKEELTRQIGIAPTLKVEKWHPDNVKHLYRIS